MKSPLCPQACVLAVSLCLTLGSCAYAGDTSLTASPAPGRPGRTTSKPPTPATLALESVTIPGPLHSFLRMAGISQNTPPDGVLAFFAHNVYTFGYQSGRETEFLLLVDRYLHQARELQALAGANETIRVANCDSAGPLLQILGYRLREGCGKKSASLATAEPERAFLTIDSGFPLMDLEEALQKDIPFSYAYHSSKVPLLFNESDWMNLSMAKSANEPDVTEVFLHQPSLARLYWGMAQIDTATAVSLKQSPGLGRLLPVADALDFYGSQICIRSGHVAVPGGAAGEAGWKQLVGASPESPGDFVGRLLGKDGGWLSAYYDALSRVRQSQQAHFTDPSRLKQLYSAFHSPNTHSAAAESSLRPAPALLVLVTRLKWEANGEPRIPGNLEIWKEILRQKTDLKVVHDWGRHDGHWTRPEQFLEAMFAFSRLQTDTGPLQAYLTLSELDSRRPAGKQLSPETVLLLARKFPDIGSWYPTFAEFPDLSDSSITSFVHATGAIDGIHNHILRGNALGILQANIGLWQILARQGEIPNAQLNDSWQKTIQPFLVISSSVQLLNAGRSSLGAVLQAATGKPDCTQDELVDLLAGPHQETPEGRMVHQQLANKLRLVLYSQRLVSLDTLFGLDTGLTQMAHGAQLGNQLTPLAAQLREFEMPRPIFTNSEKTRWAPGVYDNRHTELQLRTDLVRVVKAPSSPAQLEDARGQLTPFLRDTLVGLNYAYYEPPGSQILQSNSLFVRSHDFAGETFVGDEQPWQAPQLFNAGSPAGGGAYLAGSLADLPFALATAEQDFIAPENVQALIWKSLVPDLLVSSILPRWWNVSRNELHAVTLYQRSGEELLTASAENQELRVKVVSILSDRMDPQELGRVEQGLSTGQAAGVLPRMLPADTFYLAAEFRAEYRAEAASYGPASRELDDLSRRYPAEVSQERLSKDFGVPHPILAQSYGRELLSVKPFPPFGGNSSRLFAESWDSSNLYWGRLADEMGYSPVMLNRLVPELTKDMVAKIFANDFEDWQAMLQAMQQTGAEFRQGKIAPLVTADASYLR